MEMCPLRGCRAQPTHLMITQGPVRRRLFLIAMPAMLATHRAVAEEGDDGWMLAVRQQELTVFERARKGSDLREIKAIGLLEAPPVVIKRVIDDVDEYPRFMPYVTEARVLAREGANLVSYQRLSPPLASDRDYTVRVRCEVLDGPGGPRFRNTWSTANHLGPTVKAGIVRVGLTEGSWLLEPEDRGRKTRASYRIFSDSGGGLPSAIVNAASRAGIPKLFEAIRKQARSAKYQHAK